MLVTKRHGVDVYQYFRRRNDPISIIERINGKTWAEAAKILGVPVPYLFVFLEHAKRAGIIKEVRIK